ncbi:MAG TPA: helix-turn-helix domain-containing protein [Spongiibacteraceae bacterium]|nr:helix-turn-helix domain-containing protein [Spongiibacteraceae bacterium]
MPSRRPNPRLVKIHRSYTVEEVANLFGIHKNTVRAWIKRGLPTNDDRRPTLILGRELAAHLHANRTKNKRPCAPAELYCLRCRKPQRPAANMADFQPITEKAGNLIAICPVCHIIMNKRVSVANLEQISTQIDIAFKQALKHIGDSNQPTVNSDLK